MTGIHETAVVSPGASIGNDVTVGPFTIIEEDVVIGDDCRIASHVLLADGARMGRGIRVAQGAVIGSEPQDLKFAGEKSTAVIGDNTTIREYATINRGTIDRGETTVGENCLIMAYAHVAHDCVIGKNVILANSVNLAGHIEIDDYAILGGVLPVHQFVKIGTHAMIGGGFRVQQDIVPYALVGGYPLKMISVNSLGLKRRGFEKETVRTIERTFKILFFSKLNTSQAVERINDEIDIIPEVRTILDFIERSDRGIVK